MKENREKWVKEKGRATETTTTTTSWVFLEKVLGSLY